MGTYQRIEKEPKNEIWLSGQQGREKEWTGGTERYFLTEKNGVTTLIIKTDVAQEQEETFNIRFPRALERIKILAEKMQ